MRLRLSSGTQRLWYVRLGHQVEGPFPTAAVAQDLALGRLTPETLLSADRLTWTPASNLDAFSDLLHPSDSDAWAEQRRQALRRWADQRQGEERRTQPDEVGARRAGGDRRQGGSSREHGARPRYRSQITQGRTWVVLGGLAALLIGLVLLALLLGPGSAPAIRLLK